MSVHKPARQQAVEIANEFWVVFNTWRDGLKGRDIVEGELVWGMVLIHSTRQLWEKHRRAMTRANQQKECIDDQ